MLGSATFTTVLSSIAIARAKHIVSRTTTFSREFSPSNPNIWPPVRSTPPGAYLRLNRRAAAGVPYLGEFPVLADRERDEDDQESHDPQDRGEDEALEGGRRRARRLADGK